MSSLDTSMKRASVEKTSSSEAQQFIKLNAMLLRTMQTTMPVIMQNFMSNNMQYMSNNESMISGADLPMPSITAKELLFPAFNTLIPLFFECAVPHLNKAKNASDVSVLVGTVHQMISFAFKT